MSIYYDQNRFSREGYMATNCNAFLFTWQEVGDGKKLSGKNEHIICTT